jgi:6-phosphogluconolactonase
MTKQNEPMLVFVGSYADAENDSVYVYRMDMETGALTELDRVSGLQNPTFLSLDASNKRLYAVAEQLVEGKRQGAAVSFAIDSASGKLEELSRTGTVTMPTCHIQRDAEDRFIVTVSYSGGMVGLNELGANAEIGSLLDMKQHEGSSGVNPGRQEKPHPHSAFFSPDNRFVFIPDLGLDRIVGYRLNAAEGKLEHHGDAAVQPGAGPRHMAFHPSGKYAYVINELDSTFTSFRYNAEEGALHQLEVVSTLPEGYQGESWCAEVQISPDGAYLYGSNRGHDSIVVYAIDPNTGKLSLVDFTSTQGGHPRHFLVSPDGRFLLAANRDSDNIVVFRIDASTGKLAYTGNTIQASKPVCIKMASFQQA